MEIKRLNDEIKRLRKEGLIRTEGISDTHHTFGELYRQRAILFSVICNQNKAIAWKSLKHADGSMYEGDFIVGITTPEGEATYHFNKEFWELFDIKEIPSAPEWDGYTPEDVSQRILSLRTK